MISSIWEGFSSHRSMMGLMFRQQKL
jgi:hypothetical protein